MLLMLYSIDESSRLYRCKFLRNFILFYPEQSAVAQLVLVERQTWKLRFASLRLTVSMTENMTVGQASDSMVALT